MECDRRVKAMGVSFRRACRTGEEGGEKEEESAREGEREREVKKGDGSTADPCIGRRRRRPDRRSSVRCRRRRRGAEEERRQRRNLAAGRQGIRKLSEREEGSVCACEAGERVEGREGVGGFQQSVGKKRARESRERGTRGAEGGRHLGGGGGGGRRLRPLGRGGGEEDGPPHVLRGPGGGGPSESVTRGGTNGAAVRTQRPVLPCRHLPAPPPPTPPHPHPQQ